MKESFHNAKNISCSLKISFVFMSKSVDNEEFLHVYSRNVSRKTSLYFNGGDSLTKPFVPKPDVKKSL